MNIESATVSTAESDAEGVMQESFLEELASPYPSDVEGPSDFEFTDEGESFKAMELQAAQLYEKWDRSEQQRKRLEKELGDTMEEKLMLAQEGLEMKAQLQLLTETQGKREAEYQKLCQETEKLRTSLEEGKQALQVAMNSSEEASAKLGSRDLIVKAMTDEADEANRQKELMKKEMELAKSVVKEKDAKIQAEIDARNELDVLLNKMQEDFKKTEEHNVSTQKKFKGLENEIRVLNASIEVRDQKIQFLENQLSNEQKEADQSREKSRQIAQLEDQLAKLQRDYEGGIQMQMQLEKQAEAAEQIRQAAEKTAEECMQKMQQLHEDLQETTNKVTRLTTQRNSFKNKAESLARDLTRLCRGKTAADIEQIVGKHEELQVQVSVLRAERDHAKDEAKTYKDALEGAKEVQERAKSKGAAHQAVAQSLEMQRLLTSLTETIGEKDLQLEALRESNKMLAQQIIELEQSK